MTSSWLFWFMNWVLMNYLTSKQRIMYVDEPNCSNDHIFQAFHLRYLIGYQSYYMPLTWRKRDFSNLLSLVQKLRDVSLKFSKKINIMYSIWNKTSRSRTSSLPYTLNLSSLMTQLSHIEWIVPKIRSWATKRGPLHGARSCLLLYPHPPLQNWSSGSG